MVNPYQGNRERLNAGEYANRGGGNPGVQPSHSPRPYQPAHVGREQLNPHENQMRSISNQAFDQAYVLQSQRAPIGREHLNPFENDDRGVIRRPVAHPYGLDPNIWGYRPEIAFPPHNPQRIPAIQRRSVTDRKINNYIIALIIGFIIVVATRFTPSGIGIACFTTGMMMHRIRQSDLRARAIQGMQ